MVLNDFQKVKVQSNIQSPITIVVRKSGPPFLANVYPIDGFCGLILPGEAHFLISLTQTAIIKAISYGEGF